MKTLTSRLFLSAILATCISLTACDAGTDENAQAENTVAPKAGDLMPDPATPPEQTGVEGGGEGSMGEGSPGGEAVTESELPQSDVPPPSREVFADAECNFEAWVGKPVDEAALKATGRPYRIMKPGDMMTMDHSPQRINVEHEEGGATVTRVWCG